MPAPRSAAANSRWSACRRELAPGFAVLRGRLAEGARPRQGRARRLQIRGRLRTTAPAAAEAKLLEIALRQKRDEISKDDALRELETLSVTWRGDAIEVKTLQMLSQHLCRDRALSRRAHGGADRDQAAAELGSLAAGAGHGRRTLFTQTLSGAEGRRAAAGRCARRCSTSFAS